MTASLGTNDLVLTIVDQAHQIRRLNDMLEDQQATLNQMALQLQEAQATIEAKETAERMRLEAGEGVVGLDVDERAMEVQPKGKT